MKIFLMPSNYFINLVGMLMHRIMTLGHIVATTTIPWKEVLGNAINFLFCKEEKFDADAMLAKEATEIIRELQSSYQVSLKLYCVLIFHWPFYYYSCIKTFF